MVSLGEQLLYSTVRIECVLGDGSVSTGTGFYFQFKEKENSSIPAIVTNKHVVEGANLGKFILTKATSDGKPSNTEHLTIDLDDFENRWMPHPEEDIDLCIMPIGPIYHEASKKGFTPYIKCLDKSFIPSDEDLNSLKVIEDITMIGYPNGIWDKVNNFPIARRGITATPPNENYNGEPLIMIDAACFPGSSGSPVMIINQGSVTYKNGSTKLGVSRVLLLGILFAGPQFTATGEIHIVDVPTTQRELVVSRIPNNLGYIVKSQKLFDFESMLPDIDT